LQILLGLAALREIHVVK